MTRDSTTGRRLVGLFLLGLLLFNFPLISIFNRPTLIFGVPALYLYLFCAWLLLIVLVLIVSYMKPGIQLPERNG
jgi:hypothetical protein